MRIWTKHPFPYRLSVSHRSANNYWTKKIQSFAFLPRFALRVYVLTPPLMAAAVSLHLLTPSTSSANKANLSISIRWCTADPWGTIDFQQWWHLLCALPSLRLNHPGCSFTLRLNLMSNSQVMSRPLVAPFGRLRVRNQNRCNQQPLGPLVTPRCHMK